MTGRRPRVAFVTTDATDVDVDVDRPPVEAAGAAAGVDGRFVSWTDRSVEWAAYDLAVLRSPWDYVPRLGEFLAWLASLERVTTVANAPAIVRWNLDKRYLAELASAGVPVVPTAYAAPSDRSDTGALARLVATSAATSTSGEVVVKPAISAGSRRTGRFEGQDPAAVELAASIVAAGDTAMVQPALASVARQGETALVCIDGELSHAVRKGPILDLGGALLGGEYTEHISPTRASAAQHAVAVAVLDAVRARFGDAGDLLYARIDVVDDDQGRPVLLEAELFEPSLFVDAAPGAAERFVAAVARRARAAAGARRRG